MRLHTFVIIFLFLLINLDLVGQDILEKPIRIPYQHLSLRDALGQIETQTGLSFSYNSALIPKEQMTSIQSQGNSLATVLDNLFLQEGIQYKLVGDNIVLFEQDFKNRKFFTISGYIRDSKTLEGLQGAHIYSKDFVGTSTNGEGFFSFRLPPDSSATLSVSYLGYQTQKMQVQIMRNLRINISLNPSLDLNVVTILGLSPEELDSIQQNDPNYYNPSEFYERQSAIGGEYDPVKALQLLPGTQSGNEGGAGLYVRGSSPDQNLVLLDGIPIYYPNHLFGLFSIFNAGTIRKAELIKGPYPSKYGGRLSSILSVHSKDANLKELSGELNIGLIASNLTLEVPLQKDRTGIMIGARQSYMDFYLQPISRRVKENEGQAGNLGYQFRDLTMKFQHYFTDSDKLELIFYAGTDRYQDLTETTFQLNNPVASLSDVNMSWQNQASGIKYTKQFRNKLIGQFHLWQSRYDFNYEDFSEVVEFFEADPPLVNQAILDYQSQVSDIGFNADFDYYVSSSDQVRFGFSYIQHKFQPGANAVFEFDQSLNSTIDTSFNNITLDAQEIGMYIENEVRFNSRTKGTVGLHIASFVSDGELFTSLQPRLNIKHLSHPKIIWSASFSMMTQYLHLLTNSSLGLPTDLWIPTVGDLEPQTSRQGTLSFAYTPGNGWDINIEAFYKTLENQVTYLNESRFLLSSEDLSDGLTVGSGRAYGVEWLIRKRSPKFNAWVAYSLGRSERKFDLLNEGRTFPFKYDRRHDISIALFHKVSKKVELSATWVYGSGNVITLPESEFVVPGPAAPNYPIIIYNYGDRNNFRLPAYHRLDMGIRFETSNTWGKQVFNLGIYNVYNRENPFFISLNVDNEDPSRREFTQTSLFPIMPSLRYQINF